jgi:hypothetical protein
MRDFFRWFLVPFLIGCILGFTKASEGQEPPPVCQDIIGLLSEKFPVDDLVPLLPEKFCGSHLDWTFATRLTNLKKILDSGKVTDWQVDFFNGPCIRGGNCGRYEPYFGMTIAAFNAMWESGGGKLRRHLRDRVRLYCDFFANYPNVAIEFSPTLEHNLSSRAFRKQAAVIAQHCPRAVIVENPVGGVRSSGAFKIERHGTAVRGLKAPCSVSLDGNDAFDSNIPAFLASNGECRHYIWGLVYNLRLGDGPFIDPRKRKRVATTEQLRTLLRYAEPLPYSPLIDGCTGGILPPRLFKTSAEDKGTGDIRANKPLWITPFHGEAVNAFTAVGALPIGALEYYGPFEGGTFRYYSGLGVNLYGIEMAEKAEKLSGSPYVVLKEGGRCFGPFHPAYRHGSFR